MCVFLSWAITWNGKTHESGSFEWDTEPIHIEGKLNDSWMNIPVQVAERQRVAMPWAAHPLPPILVIWVGKE